MTMGVIDHYNFEANEEIGRHHACGATGTVTGERDEEGGERRGGKL